MSRARSEAEPGDRPVCLVTGAGGRLGSAFCRRYADRYRIVAVWHRRRPVAPSQGQVLIDPLHPGRSLPVNRHHVHDIQADLRAEKEISRLVDRVLRRFGRIDVIVNAAVDGRWAPLLNGCGSMDETTAALRLNVAAPLALISEVSRRSWSGDIPENRRSNRCVVNVSSSAGIYVYEGYGQGVYSASKAALNFLTRHLASELELIGVRANALAPDAFPGRVEISRVLDGLIRLTEGNLTGRVLLQLSGGIEYVLSE
jgi:NAD(P)-dependent dehydrogenase (short-subunit alcohol dehydrogenase family)